MIIIKVCLVAVAVMALGAGLGLIFLWVMLSLNDGGSLDWPNRRQVAERKDPPDRSWVEFDSGRSLLDRVFGGRTFGGRRYWY